jgi:hypothetical protein
MGTKDPVDELKETRLYLALQAADGEFADRIAKFVTGVAPILATTVNHFPYYTRHDAHHGYNVVKRIDQIVKADCFAAGTSISFAPAEIFLLIAAAYAHDLGMTVFPGEEDRLLGRLGVNKFAGWQTHLDLQTYLRAEHSRRGGIYIGENNDALMVPRPLVSALDKMMQAHNLSIAELEQELHLPYAAQAKELDALQLSAIVCIADALEFSDTRVIDGVLEKVVREKSKAARISYQENMKHVCIGESLAVRPEDGSVVVSGTFSDEEVLALAHRTFDEIEGWVQGYCDIDRRSKRPRLLIRPEPFTRNFAFSSGRFERLGVRLNKKNVIELISSNAIWQSNKGIAIRELVQNAVEACRYRAHHSSSADAYLPAVTVDFDRRTHTVAIKDNGCGMSERTVLNNFLTVGSSRSREPGYAETGYAPIARFGVGFWSVFTIADQAHVETAEFEPCRSSPAKAQEALGFGFDVSLDEIKEYTVFRPLKRPCGTDVHLKLRSDVVIDDVYAQGTTMLLCSKVPVTFILDGKETEAPTEVPDVSATDVLGPRGRLMDDHGVRLFQWRGETADLEVAMGIAYRMGDGKATFLVDESSSLLQVLGSMRHPKTSVCGFVVPMHGSRTCIDLNRVGIYFANKKSPLGIEFTLDRQSLQFNQTALEFARGITELIHDGYRAFLAETNSNDAKTITALREQAAMHGGNVFDTFTGTELVDAVESYPDLLSALLLPVSADKKCEEVVPLYLDLDGLQRLSGTVFFMQRQPENYRGHGNRYHIELDSASATRISYDIVSSWMIDGSVTEPAYVMAADRVGSMLFDADPDSSVRSQLTSRGTFYVQCANFNRMSFDRPPTGILKEVQGKWAGAVYEREFKTFPSKSYLFLGRHRVLVAKSSPLAAHIAKLAAENRKLEIANLIADLQEDEQGYTPATVARFL